MRVSRKISYTSINIKVKRDNKVQIRKKYPGALPFRVKNKKSNPRAVGHVAVALDIGISAPD